MCHMEIIVTNNNNGFQADNYKRYFEDAVYNYRIKNHSFSIAVFCNFDAQSLCEFTQGTGDQFDWTLNSGATSSGPSTGPTNDVSSRGQRLFYESNNSFKGSWITSCA